LLAATGICALALLAAAPAAVGSPAAPVPSPQESVTRIGVTEAPRGREETLKQFSPVAAYLDQQIPGRRFELVVLDFEGLEKAVAAGDVDYTICNPSFYVLLETRYGITRVTTMLRRSAGELESEFGSVVFTRADSEVHSYDDIVGGSFMAMHPTSFGGWQMAQREFVLRDIDPAKDFDLSFTTEGIHDEVVEAVLSGQVDAGCVRTGILEAMAEEGKLDLRDIRVLEPRSEPGFSDLLSTPLYPEWALAKTNDADRELTESITAALFKLDDIAPEALVGDVGGWTVPLSYLPVHELLEDLHLPPYDVEAEFTAGEALRRYWVESLAVALALAVLIGAVTVVGRLNRRLAHANVELEHANEAKSRFLAKMSHELRTPLNSIIGFSGLIINGMVGEISEEQSKQLRIVNDSGKHLLGLVNDVLDLSRIEAGTLVFTPRTFSVADVMGAVDVAFKAAAAEKGLTLEVDDQTLGAELASDESRIRQVLFNLVDNAIKFTDEGGVWLSADLDGDSVVFLVRDTGCGIPADRRSSVFEEFHQIAPADGGLAQGLGLGLAISRSLAALLGGKLKLRPAEPGDGCTFELRIPRLPADE
jgi:signal transduction histidine kinase